MPAQRLRAGALWEAAARRRDDALASGALQPIATRIELVPDGRVAFAVRVLGGADQKRRAARAQRKSGTNPFADPDPALVVGDVSDTHLCLLNRFPVLDDHLLLVTRRYADQEAPLDAGDFEALFACLDRGTGGALGFYNAGPVAGASQPHKHLQVVRLPLAEGTAPVPIEPLLRDAVPARGVGVAQRLPFAHALARTPGGADAALALYGELLEAVGAPRAYNLLVTRDWTLLVPRVRSGWEGIEVNALGFAGAVLVRDDAALARLRRLGPLTLLRGVAGDG
jgi:ATP adenylyltransferase